MKTENTIITEKKTWQTPLFILLEVEETEKARSAFETTVAGPS
ncbi:MAG: hypothetical protein NT150_01770 [Bacteroidetes bacterium]|nr:hypothetical protein [Bacteroidota bacterium]